jgi:uncharacterized repeat protein (TIGR03803 family)
MLAGCGGESTPLSPSTAGVAAQRMRPSGAYKVLYNFRGSPDGQKPLAGLIDVNGTLYGTTAEGGAHFPRTGTVFSLNPTTGAESVLYSFGSSYTDGQYPMAGVIDVNGTLYGTTLEGGAYSNYYGAGYGTVFSLNLTTGAESVLYSFGSSYTDGRRPMGGVIYVNGTLYGTTYKGGAVHNHGTVFSLNLTTGAESVLSFDGKHGSLPRAGLIDRAGTLYGTTSEGGANRRGTVFSFNPTTGRERVLYSFRGAPDGEAPYAHVADVKGTLYGTTLEGGANGHGIVFSLNPTTGAESVLYSFGSSSSDGQSPYASVTHVKDTLYGTTYGGGASGLGTVFSLNRKTGAQRVLHSFGSGSSDGQSPYAGLIDVNGTLYGTTYGGGAYGDGTVFSITP